MLLVSHPPCILSPYHPMSSSTHSNDATTILCKMTTIFLISTSKCGNGQR